MSKRILSAFVALLVLFGASAEASLVLQTGVVRHIVQTGTVAAGLLDYGGLIPTRYVDDAASGSDSGLSPASPWTLAQAMTCSGCVPGEVVGIDGGTYTGVGTDEELIPSWRPLVSGTSGSPITYVAKRLATYNTTGLTILRNGNDRAAAQADQSKFTGNATFGANGANYIRWMGIKVDEFDSPSFSGGIAVLSNTTGSEILYSDLIGDPNLYTYIGNHSAVRVENATSCRVANTRIRDISISGGTTTNYAAILTYEAKLCVLEHNDIANSDQGIFVKDDVNDTGQYGNTIRYNQIADIGDGATLGSGMQLGNTNSTGASDVTAVYQNLILRAYIGIQLRYIDLDEQAHNNLHITNNTIVDSATSDVYWKGELANANTELGVRIRDNLFYSPGSRYWRMDEWDTTELAQLVTNIDDIDFNHGFGASSWGNTAAGPQTTRANWTSATGLESAGTGTGDPNLDANYCPQAGSPALTSSSTGGEVGMCVGDPTIGLLPP